MKRHGRRISGQEFDQQVSQLAESLPVTPTPAQDRAARRRELDLTIDLRLGVDFPAERRDMLWAIQEKIEKARLRYAFRWFLSRLIRHPDSDRSGKLAGYVVDQYANVLDEEELRCYFGDHEVDDHQSRP